jgi:hypothetical protein
VNDVVVSGTVRVRDKHGREWDEIVEVFEADLDDTDGTTLTPEDAARRQARRQAGPSAVETFEVDLS